MIDWETAHPTEDGFNVQISEDGETWTDVEFTASREITLEGDDSKNHQIDTITFEAVTAKGVRVNCFKAYTTDGGDVKEHPSVFKFEVYNTAAEAAE